MTGEPERTRKTTRGRYPTPPEVHQPAQLRMDCARVLSVYTFALVVLIKALGLSLHAAHCRVQKGFTATRTAQWHFAFGGVFDADAGC